VAAAVFGSWQYSAPDNGLAGGIARAGVLYAPVRHGFVRAAFDYATSAPHTSAVSISIGAYWR